MARVFVRMFGDMARAACILVAISVGGVGYAVENSAAVSPAPNAKRPASGSGGTSSKRAPDVPEKPLWTELSPEQQFALAPLAGEWDKLRASQKKKWLAISRKYASLKPDQQVRLQDRMRDWVKLTPEQRRVARESYYRAKKLNSDQKAAEWQQYQQLSEEQKKKLADDAAARKRITNLPPASQTKGKLTPPPKPPRNPNARQSTEPPQANEAVKQPSQQSPVK
jgi:hypothetical protein